MTSSLVVGRTFCNLLKSIDLKNEKYFKFLLRFWNPHQILNILKERWASQLNYFKNCWLRKTWLLKCLKDPVSEHPLAFSALTGFKHCWNLHDGTLILLTFWNKLRWKTSFIVRSEILGLLVKILTSDDKYSHHFRENFLQPSQMQLS